MAELLNVFCLEQEFRLSCDFKQSMKGLQVRSSPLYDDASKYSTNGHECHNLENMSTLRAARQRLATCTGGPVLPKSLMLTQAATIVFTMAERQHGQLPQPAGCDV